MVRWLMVLILCVLFSIPALAQIHITADVGAFTKLLPVSDFQASNYNILAAVGFLSPGGKNFYYGASTGYATDRKGWKAIPTVVTGQVTLGSIVLKINTGVWWVENESAYNPNFNVDLLLGFNFFKDLPLGFDFGLRQLEDETSLVVNLSY